MLRFKNFLLPDHAVAIYSAVFILIAQIVTQLEPTFAELGLSPSTVGAIVIVAAVCSTIGGYLKANPAVTLASAITLLVQIVTLLLDNNVGDHSAVHKFLILLSATLVVLAKLTTSVTDPTNPMATGVSLPPASTGNTADDVVKPATGTN